MASPSNLNSRGGDRLICAIELEPRQDGRASHVAISVDFSGHGLGKLLLPGVTRQARKEAPQNWQKLKERLEQAG